MPPPSPSVSPSSSPSALADVKVRSALDLCRAGQPKLQPQDVLTIAGIEPSGTQLGASQNKVVCNSSDSDPYFQTIEPVGPYYVSPKATVTLIGYSDASHTSPRMFPATVPELRVILDKCKQHYPVAAPYACGPNYYHVTYDASTFAIDSIVQLWQS